MSGTAPAGGTLFCIWARTADPGTVTWRRANLLVYQVQGANWHLQGVTLNVTNGSPSGGLLNANSMLFVDPGYGYIGDYTYFVGEQSDAVLRGWSWAAWQVVVLGDRFLIRQWLRFGLDQPVLAPQVSEVTFDSVRQTLVASYGWTPAQAAAWTPGDAVSFYVFDNNYEQLLGGYVTHARMYARSTEPTLAELEALSAQGPPDPGAWGDYGLVWDGTGASLLDRSGHGHDLSLQPGNSLVQGVLGPPFVDGY